MEGVKLSDIAREFGTPCYVYSEAALTTAFQRLDGALKSASRWLALFDLLRGEGQFESGHLEPVRRWARGSILSPAANSGACWLRVATQAAWCSPVWARPPTRWRSH